MNHIGDVQFHCSPFTFYTATRSVKVVFNLQDPPSGEFILYHRMLGKLLTTCSNQLKQPIGELLVAVDHNQLPTMASETVDPIDWSHPPTLMGSTP